MATERVLGASGQGDSLVHMISILGARRRELKASAGERLLLLEGRDAVAEARRVEIEARLAGLEAQLEVLERARAAASLRAERRRERIVQLKQHLQILRARAESGEQARAGSSVGTSNASMHQLGSLLMYLGGLLMLWVVLLELGLALGLT